MINPEMNRTHPSGPPPAPAGSAPLLFLRSVPLPGRPISPSAGVINMTADHEKIRRWVTTRGGKPAAVVPLDEALFGRKEMGALRIVFPDRYEAGNVKELSWELFFELFDLRRLAFLYQEQSATGAQSRFNKFIKRERVPQPDRLKLAA